MVIFINFWVWILMVMIWILKVESSKILVWSPLLGRSHVRFMARIADVLVEDGHNVTFFQTVFDPDTSPEYDTLAQNIIVHHPSGVNPKFLYLFDYKNSQVFKRTENLLWPDNPHRLLKISLDQCRGLIGDSITSHFIKEKFDLVIFELIDLCPGLWLQYLKVDKIIAASSYGTAPAMEVVSGINANPSYVPCKCSVLLISRIRNHFSYL